MQVGTTVTAARFYHNLRTGGGDLSLTAQKDITRAPEGQA